MEIIHKCPRYGNTCRLKWRFIKKPRNFCNLLLKSVQSRERELVFQSSLVPVVEEIEGEWEG